MLTGNVFDHKNMSIVCHKSPVHLDQTGGSTLQIIIGPKETPFLLSPDAMGEKIKARQRLHFDQEQSFFIFLKNQVHFGKRSAPALLQKLERVEMADDLSLGPKSFFIGRIL